jgi:hypothetical protein
LSKAAELLRGYVEVGGCQDRVAFEAHVGGEHVVELPADDERGDDKQQGDGELEDNEDAAERPLPAVGWMHRLVAGELRPGDADSGIKTGEQGSACNDRHREEDDRRGEGVEGETGRDIVAEEQ